MSENKSSISKAEKNLSPFYRSLNNDIFKELIKDKPCQLIGRRD